MIKIGIWSRFETEFINLRQYKDPYSKVELRVSCTSPDGSVIDFCGFYDGENTWKIRFMPDKLGLWKYNACFSDDTEQFRGEFECVESDIPGMIHKDENNPIWFGFKGGKHIIIRSLHVGDRFFAENWDEKKRTEFLDWLQLHGYNTLSIASHYLNRDKIDRGLGWKTPKLWPLDAGEYRKMESILDQLEQRRIIVYPFAGFFGRESYFPTSKKDQNQYIKYTMARLGAYWNILLNVAGPEPLMPNDPFLTKEVIDNLGRMVQEYNIYGHLITIHNATSKEFFRNEGYIDYTTLQGPKTTDRSRLLTETLEFRKDNCPILSLETLWPGNNLHPEYSDDDIRKNAFVLNMAAAAIVLGDMNGDSSSGFSGTMEINEAVETRHEMIGRVWDFFESIEYFNMTPSPQLVDNGCCLAKVGTEVLVYLEDGGEVKLQLEDGNYEVQWINARNTNQRTELKTINNAYKFVAPDGSDWLLHLKKKKTEV
mgnify:CR=1 FL=1